MAEIPGLEIHHLETLTEASVTGAKPESPIDRAAVAIRVQGKRLSTAIGLGDPIVLAQAIAAGGFIALGAVCWRFWNVILAVILFLMVFKPGGPRF